MSDNNQPGIDALGLGQFTIVNPYSGVSINTGSLIEEAIADLEMGDSLKFSDGTTRTLRFVGDDFETSGVGFQVHEKYNSIENKYVVHTACAALLGRECQYCLMSDAVKQAAGIKTRYMFGHQVWIPSVSGLGRSVLSLYAANIASPLPKIAALDKQIKEAARRNRLKNPSLPDKSINDYWLTISQKGVGRAREFTVILALDQAAYPETLPAECVRWTTEELLQLSLMKYSPEMFQDSIPVVLSTAIVPDPGFGFADNLKLPNFNLNKK